MPQAGRVVTSPNLGLIFDRPPVNIPIKGLRDGLNFRVKNGTLESRNLGWQKFSDNWTLDGPVWLIDNFFPRGEAERLIFATAQDMYYYDSDNDQPIFITPTYTTGTASASGTAVTGVGTTWGGGEIKPGDMIAFGSATANTQAETWYEVDSVPGNTSIVLTASAGTVAAGPYTIRQRFSDATLPEWSVDTFVNDGDSGGDLWFATNGIDPVVTWDGVAPTVTSHPELGFTCKVLTTYSNMMVYGNISQSGDLLFSSIINSDIGLPLHAGATGTGLSEQFVVHSNTDEILNMIPLGDYLVIYSERTIVPAQFVGDPLIFTFRVSISGVGPVSGNALADFGDFHEFLGADAGYLFDGVTLKETNSHVWRDILRQADPKRRRQVFGHFDEEQGDLIWSIPSTTDDGAGEEGANAEVAWPEHYLEEASDPNFEGSPFSKRTFPFLITGFYQQQTGVKWEDLNEQWQNYNFSWNDQATKAAFPLNLAGDKNGQIYILNTVQQADGVPLPSFVRTSRMTMSTGREKDLLTRVYPFAHSLPYNLEIGAYMGLSVGLEPTFKGMKSINQSTLDTQHFVTFYRRGRTLELQFGSSVGDPWILDGWDWDKVNGGYR